MAALYRHWQVHEIPVQPHILQRSFRRSRGSLTRLLFALLLLVLPLFQQSIRSLRAPRRFWAAPRGQGFWEKNIRGLSCEMGRSHPDWDENQYLQHFRMSRDTFWYLVQTFGKYFKNRIRICNVHYPLPKG